MTEHDGERTQRCAAITGTGNRCRKAALPGSSRCHHHSFSVPGRPGKLTPALQEQIIDGVLGGNYLETAAQIAGVGKSTLYRWLRRADDVEARALEHAEGDLEDVDVYELVDPAEWIYLDFRHALKSAEAFAEADLLAKTRAAGASWQAFMTILERRHPDKWGRRKTLDHTIRGKIDSRARVEIFAPSDPARAGAVAAILARSDALGEPENTPDE